MSLRYSNEVILLDFLTILWCEDPTNGFGSGQEPSFPFQYGGKVPEPDVGPGSTLEGYHPNRYYIPKMHQRANVWSYSGPQSAHAHSHPRSSRTVSLQAPSSMKSVISSLWILTGSIGSAIVIVISAVFGNSSQVQFMLFTVIVYSRV